MANRYRRRRRKRFRVTGRLYTLVGCAVLIGLSAWGIAHLTSNRPDAASPPPLTPPPELQTPAPAAEPAMTPSAIPSPTPTATPSAAPSATADPAVWRPTPKPGVALPAFHGGRPEEKLLCVTIDDCYQQDNLESILDLADKYGAKLTFFPIGKNVRKNPELWKRAIASGHEIENHTYDHVELSPLSDEAMAYEIDRQNQEVNRALRVDYQMHFLRPMGGSTRYDKRTHRMLAERGYKGVAIWSVSGTRDYKKTLKLIDKGSVVLFHTTDKDLKNLKKFIPAVVKKGYKLVTLNEMFGFPPNEMGPFVKTTTIPTPRPSPEPTPASTPTPEPLPPRPDGLS